MFAKKRLLSLAIIFAMFATMFPGVSVSANSKTVQLLSPSYIGTLDGTYLTAGATDQAALIPLEPGTRSTSNSTGKITISSKGLTRKTDFEVYYVTNSSAPKTDADAGTAYGTSFTFKTGTADVPLYNYIVVKPLAGGNVIVDPEQEYTVTITLSSVLPGSVGATKVQTVKFKPAEGAKIVEPTVTTHPESTTSNVPSGFSGAYVGRTAADLTFAEAQTLSSATVSRTPGGIDPTFAPIIGNEIDADTPITNGYLLGSYNTTGTVNYTLNLTNTTNRSQTYRYQVTRYAGDIEVTSTADVATNGELVYTITRKLPSGITGGKADLPIRLRYTVANTTGSTTLNNRTISLDGVAGSTTELVGGVRTDSGVLEMGTAQEAVLKFKINAEDPGAFGRGAFTLTLTQDSLSESPGVADNVGNFAIGNVASLVPVTVPVIGPVPGRASFENNDAVDMVASMNNDVTAEVKVTRAHDSGQSFSTGRVKVVLYKGEELVEDTTDISITGTGYEAGVLTFENQLAERTLTITIPKEASAAGVQNYSLNLEKVEDGQQICDVVDSRDVKTINVTYLPATPMITLTNVTNTVEDVIDLINATSTAIEFSIAGNYSDGVTKAELVYWNGSTWEILSEINTGYSTITGALNTDGLITKMNTAANNNGGKVKFAVRMYSTGSDYRTSNEVEVPIYIENIGVASVKLYKPDQTGSVIINENIKLSAITEPTGEEVNKIDTDNDSEIYFAVVFSGLLMENTYSTATIPLKTTANGSAVNAEFVTATDDVVTTLWFKYTVTASDKINRLNFAANPAIANAETIKTSKGNAIDGSLSGNDLSKYKIAVNYSSYGIENVKLFYFNSSEDSTNEEVRYFKENDTVRLTFDTIVPYNITSVKVAGITYVGDTVNPAQPNVDGRYEYSYDITLEDVPGEGIDGIGYITIEIKGDQYWADEEAPEYEASADYRYYYTTDPTITINGISVVREGDSDEPPTKIPPSFIARDDDKLIVEFTSDRELVLTGDDTTSFNPEAKALAADFGSGLTATLTKVEEEQLRSNLFKYTAEYVVADSDTDIDGVTFTITTATDRAGNDVNTELTRAYSNAYINVDPVTSATITTGEGTLGISSEIKLVFETVIPLLETDSLATNSTVTMKWIGAGAEEKKALTTADTKLSFVKTGTGNNEYTVTYNVATGDPVVEGGSIVFELELKDATGQVSVVKDATSSNDYVLETLKKEGVMIDTKVAAIQSIAVTTDPASPPTDAKNVKALTEGNTVKYDVTFDKPLVAGKVYMQVVDAKIGTHSITPGAVSIDSTDNHTATFEITIPNDSAIKNGDVLEFGLTVTDTTGTPAYEGTFDYTYVAANWLNENVYKIYNNAPVIQNDRADVERQTDILVPVGEDTSGVKYLRTGDTINIVFDVEDSVETSDITVMLGNNISPTPTQSTAPVALLGAPMSVNGRAANVELVEIPLAIAPMSMVMPLTVDDEPQEEPVITEEPTPEPEPEPTPEPTPEPVDGPAEGFNRYVASYTITDIDGLSREPNYGIPYTIQITAVGPTQKSITNSAGDFKFLTQKNAPTTSIIDVSILDKDKKTKTAATVATKNEYISIVIQPSNELAIGENGSKVHLAYENETLECTIKLLDKNMQTYLVEYKVPVQDVNVLAGQLMFVAELWTVFGVKGDVTINDTKLNSYSINTEGMKVVSIKAERVNDNAGTALDPADTRPGAVMAGDFVKYTIEANQPLIVAANAGVSSPKIQSSDVSIPPERITISGSQGVIIVKVPNNTTLSNNEIEIGFTLKGSVDLDGKSFTYQELKNDEKIDESNTVRIFNVAPDVAVTEVKAYRPTPTVVEPEQPTDQGDGGDLGDPIVYGPQQATSDRTAIGVVDDKYYLTTDDIIEATVTVSGAWINSAGIEPTLKVTMTGKDGETTVDLGKNFDDSPRVTQVSKTYDGTTLTYTMQYIVQSGVTTENCIVTATAQNPAETSATSQPNTVNFVIDSAVPTVTGTPEFKVQSFDNYNWQNKTDPDATTAKIGDRIVMNFETTRELNIDRDDVAKTTANINIGPSNETRTATATIIRGEGDTGYHYVAYYEVVAGDEIALAEPGTDPETSQPITFSGTLVDLAGNSNGYEEDEESATISIDTETIIESIVVTPQTTPSRFNVRGGETVQYVVTINNEFEEYESEIVADALEVAASIEGVALDTGEISTVSYNDNVATFTVTIPEDEVTDGKELEIALTVNDKWGRTTEYSYDTATNGEYILKEEENTGLIKEETTVTVYNVVPDITINSLTVGRGTTLETIGAKDGKYYVKDGDTMTVSFTVAGSWIDKLAQAVPSVTIAGKTATVVVDEDVTRGANTAAYTATYEVDEADSIQEAFTDGIVIISENPAAKSATKTNADGGPAFVIDLVAPFISDVSFVIMEEAQQLFAYEDKEGSVAVAGDKIVMSFKVDEPLDESVSAVKVNIDAYSVDAMALNGATMAQADGFANGNYVYTATYDVASGNVVIKDSDDGFYVVDFAEPIKFSLSLIDYAGNEKTSLDTATVGENVNITIDTATKITDIAVTVLDSSENEINPQRQEVKADEKVKYTITASEELKKIKAVNIKIGDQPENTLEPVEVAVDTDSETGSITITMPSEKNINGVLTLDFELTDEFDRTFPFSYEFMTTDTGDDADDALINSGRIITLDNTLPVLATVDDGDGSASVKLSVDNSTGINVVDIAQYADDDHEEANPLYPWNIELVDKNDYYFTTATDHNSIAVKFRTNKELIIAAADGEPVTQIVSATTDANKELDIDDVVIALIDEGDEGDYLYEISGIVVPANTEVARGTLTVTLRLVDYIGNDTGEDDDAVTEVVDNVVIDTLGPKISNETTVVIAADNNTEPDLEYPKTGDKIVYTFYTDELLTWQGETDAMLVSSGVLHGDAPVIEFIEKDDTSGKYKYTATYTIDKDDEVDRVNTIKFQLYLTDIANNPATHVNGKEGSERPGATITNIVVDNVEMNWLETVAVAVDAKALVDGSVTLVKDQVVTYSFEATKTITGISNVSITAGDTAVAGYTTRYEGKNGVIELIIPSGLNGELKLNGFTIDGANKKFKVVSELTITPKITVDTVVFAVAAPAAGLIMKTGETEEFSFTKAIESTKTSIKYYPSIFSLADGTTITAGEVFLNVPDTERYAFQPKLAGIYAISLYDTVDNMATYVCVVNAAEFDSSVSVPKTSDWKYDKDSRILKINEVEYDVKANAAVHKILQGIATDKAIIVTNGRVTVYENPKLMPMYAIVNITGTPEENYAADLVITYDRPLKNESLNVTDFEVEGIAGLADTPITSVAFGGDGHEVRLTLAFKTDNIIMSTDQITVTYNGTTLKFVDTEVDVATFTDMYVTNTAASPTVSWELDGSNPKNTYTVDGVTATGVIYKGGVYRYEEEVIVGVQFVATAAPAGIYKVTVASVSAHISETANIYAEDVTTTPNHALLYFKMPAAAIEDLTISLSKLEAAEIGVTYKLANNSNNPGHFGQNSLTEGIIAQAEGTDDNTGSIDFLVPKNGEEFAIKSFSFKDNSRGGRKYGYEYDGSNWKFVAYVTTFEETLGVSVIDQFAAALQPDASGDKVNIVKLETDISSAEAFGFADKVETGRTIIIDGGNSKRALNFALLFSGSMGDVTLKNLTINPLESTLISSDGRSAVIVQETAGAKFDGVTINVPQSEADKTYGIMVGKTAGNVEITNCTIENINAKSSAYAIWVSNPAKTKVADNESLKASIPLALAELTTANLANMSSLDLSGNKFEKTSDIYDVLLLGLPAAQKTSDPTQGTIDTLGSYFETETIAILNQLIKDNTSSVDIRLVFDNGALLLQYDNGTWSRVN